MRHQDCLRRWICFVLILCMGMAQVTLAQATSATGGKPALKQEELDQMIAPVALYPDSLLSQMFMASTYPLEIVQADRWVKGGQWLDQARVLGLQIAVLVRSDQIVTEGTSRSYTLLDKVINAPADGRLRRVFTYSQAFRGRSG